MKKKKKKKSAKTSQRLAGLKEEQGEGDSLLEQEGDSFWCSPGQYI
jgi:hypothetical protein